MPYPATSPTTFKARLGGARRLRFLIHHFASEPFLFDRDCPDFLHDTCRNVSINDNEVGQLASFERSFFFLLKRQPHIIYCVKSQGLFSSNNLFGMQRRIAPARLPSQRGPESQKLPETDCQDSPNADCRYAACDLSRLRQQRPVQRVSCTAGRNRFVLRRIVSAVSFHPDAARSAEYRRRFPVL